MYVLGIDTSTLTGGVALLQNGQLVGESVLNIRTTHSERLLPALETLLQQGEVSPHELDGISVVTGPGSFTGIRIGVATAKGLAYALGTDLLGATTLEVYGWQFRCYSHHVIPLVDARRQQVYWQVFRAGEPLTKPGHGSLGEVLEFCLTYGENYLFVGDGSLVYSAEISQQLPDAMFPRAALALLRPAAVADLGYTRFLAGESTPVFNVNPTYLRKTEAERKWQGRE